MYGNLSMPDSSPDTPQEVKIMYTLSAQAFNYTPGLDGTSYSMTRWSSIKPVNPADGSLSIVSINSVLPLVVSSMGGMAIMKVITTPP